MKFTHNEKEFEFNDSLKIYLNKMNYFANKQNEFITLINNDLLRMTEPTIIFKNMETVFNRFIMELIKELAEYGFYDKTCEDYLETNQGYLDLLTAVNKYYDYVHSIDQEQLSIAQNEINQIEVEEDRNITGLQFGIISNSITAHILYGLQNDSVIRKQTKQAEKNFIARGQVVLTNKKATVNRKSESYYKNTFSDDCKNSIISFMSYIFGVYINDLDKCKQIDKKCISGINLERSFSLLKNLEVVPDKKKLLYTAIETCPYNNEIYEKAISLYCLDEIMFDIAHWLDLDQYVIELITKQIEKSDTNGKKQLISISEYIVSNISNPESIHLYERTLNQVQLYFINLIDDHPFDFKSTTCLDNIHKCVYDVIPEAEFQFLLQLFGEKRVTQTLASKSGTTFYNYHQFMDDLCGALYKITENAYHQSEEIKKLNHIAAQEKAKANAIQKKKHQEELIKKQEELEKTKLEKKRKITKTTIIAFTSVIFITIIAILININIKNTKYNNAVEAYNNGNYKVAISYFENSNYKDSSEYLIKTYAGIGTTTDDVNICEDMYNKVSTNEQKVEIILHETDLYIESGDLNKSISTLNGKVKELPELQTMYESKIIDAARNELTNNNYEAAFNILAGFQNTNNSDYISIMNDTCANLINNLNCKFEVQYMSKIAKDYYDRENVENMYYCRYALSYIDGNSYIDVDKAKSLLTNVSDNYYLKNKISNYINNVEKISGDYFNSEAGTIVKSITVEGSSDIDGNLFYSINYENDPHIYGTPVTDKNGQTYELNGDSLIVTSKNGHQIVYKHN